MIREEELSREEKKKKKETQTRRALAATGYLRGTAIGIGGGGQLGQLRRGMRSGGFHFHTTWTSTVRKVPQHVILVRPSLSHLVCM